METMVAPAAAASRSLPARVRQTSPWPGIARKRPESSGFEFGERGAEDGFGASEVFDQLSRLGGAEAMGQRNGQPLQQMRGRRDATTADKWDSERTVLSAKKRCQGHMSQGLS